MPGRCGNLCPPRPELACGLPVYPQPDAADFRCAFSANCSDAASFRPRRATVAVTETSPTLPIVPTPAPESAPRVVAPAPAPAPAATAATPAPTPDSAA